jgi:hypothetical protein
MRKKGKYTEPNRIWPIDYIMGFFGMYIEMCVFELMIEKHARCP